jgi:hypothetical protein
MPRRSNRPKVADLRTEEECIHWMKVDAFSLYNHSRLRRGRPVNPITANMYAGWWKSTLNRLEEIRRSSGEERE